MTTATLHAPNISCGHCVSAIKRAVGKLPGVSRVDGNPSSKLVTVSFDPDQTPLATILSTMQEEGYPATPKA